MYIAFVIVLNAAVAGMLSASLPALFGENLEDGSVYGLEWIKKRLTRKGETGTCRIRYSNNAARLPGCECRIHLCAFNPCLAHYSDSRYHCWKDTRPVEMHLQPVPTPAVLPAIAVDLESPAVAEASAPPVAPPPGSLPPPLSPEEPPPADPPPLAVEPPLPPPAEPPLLAEPPAEPPLPPPAEPPPSVVEAPTVGLPEVQLDDLFELPPWPVFGVVKGVKAAAPAPPLELSDDDQVIAPAVAVFALVGASEAARHRIRSRLLTLAREIRKPRQPVGYSAFVLFALLKDCAVCMWEGNLPIDLLDTFAPWAKDPKTTRLLKVTGIPCTLVSTGGSSLACMPVSEQYPLRHIGHFVAGLPIPGSAVAGDSSGFDGFYAALGIAPLATVADGDCAFDVMKQMLGEVSTLESRTNLRVDICD